MNENLKKLYEAASADTTLQEKLKVAGTAEDVITIAKEYGIELMEADLKKSVEILSDNSLETVSGGGAAYGQCTCVAAGGGGGEDAKETVFGCACVAYGQGGDGNEEHWKCFCFLGGTGDYE